MKATEGRVGGRGRPRPLRKKAAGGGRGPRWVAVLAGVFCVVSAFGVEPVAITGRAMGTTWRVAFRGAGEVTNAEELRRRVAERLEVLEQIFSTYRPTSEVSRFNASAGCDWIEVSAELAEVARRSREISELTGGAFDATIAPLVALWGFGPARERGTWPDEAAIGAARSLVGFRRLEVRATPPALRKMAAGLAVDFSSLAKGFAADEVSALLVAAGVADHLVQIGGDMKSHGGVWRVGIERPGSEVPGVAAVVELAGGAALSTSGDARNARMREGRRYGHIIDPRTGRPVEPGAASVSVLAAACARSSALATGLFVLGPEDGLSLAARERLAVLYLIREGERFVFRGTRGFEAVRVKAEML